MSINVYKHFNVLINVCFKCVFVLCFIGEIRSNGRINEEVKLQKELAYLFCTYFILGFLYLVLLISPIWYILQHICKYVNRNTKYYLLSNIFSNLEKVIICSLLAFFLILNSMATTERTFLIVVYSMYISVISLISDMLL